MLFVSSARRFQKAIHGEKWEHHPATGERTEHHPALVLEFRQGGLPEWARDVAKRTLRTSGVGSDETIDERLSMFDTDEAARRAGWPAEYKKMVEDVLIRDQSEYYVKVDLPKLPKPWRNIDDVRGGGRGVTRGKQLITTADAVGVSLAELLLYARQEGYPADVVAELEAEEKARDAATSEELVQA